MSDLINLTDDISISLQTLLEVRKTPEGIEVKWKTSATSTASIEIEGVQGLAVWKAIRSIGRPLDQQVFSMAISDQASKISEPETISVEIGKSKYAAQLTVHDQVMYVATAKTDSHGEVSGSGWTREHALERLNARLSFKDILL